MFKKPISEIKIEEKDYSEVIKTEKKDDSVVGSARDELYKNRFSGNTDSQ